MKKTNGLWNRCLGLMMLLLLSLLMVGCSGLRFESKELSNGKVGEEYTASVASGGDNIYYELDYDSTLPLGLSLSEDGTISGTPGESGSATFLIIASEGDDYKEAEFTITIDKGSLAYESKELPGGMTGQPYLQNVGTATGADSISYALKEGSTLPEGLTLSETGELSGVPAAALTAEFTIVASAEGCEPVEVSFSFAIEEGNSGPTDLGHIEFEGWNLTDAEAGTEYNESISKAYGVPGIKYSIEYVNGISFPKGLEFNELGFIHGIPENSTSGVMQFKITASADGFDSVTVECNFRVYDKYVDTNTFEAEHIDVSKLQGAGYSSSPSGRGMLQKFASASNGYALGYLHKAIKVDFNINSDKESKGKLILGFGTEVGTITFTPDNFKIYVNNTEISYGSIEVLENGTGQSTVFQEFALSPDITIKEGENKLTFEVLNTTEKAEIGTSTAKGPIIDYIKIDGSDAKLGWRPVVANTGK